MSRTAVRWILYLLPLVAWAIFVVAWGKPRNFEEFMFVGHWYLIPVFFLYLVWTPLVRWLTRG